MKSEELFEVLGDINENDIKIAATFTTKKKLSKVRLLPYACAAAALLIVIISIPMIMTFNIDDTEQTGNTTSVITADPGMVYDIILDSGDPSGNTTDNSVDTDGSPVTYDDFYPNDYTVPENIRVIRADIPNPSGTNMTSREFLNGEAHWEWWCDYKEWYSASQELNHDLNDYYLSMMEQTLVSDEKNTVCSPLNTFIAFSVLAEISDGNTRQQILDMLGVSDIENLRTIVSTLWNSNYINTPEIKSILANSIWLNESLTYNDDTLNTLADKYYVASFIGDPGNTDMSEALQNWTNHNTGGLLEESVKELNLDPTTVMAIVSTIYYKAMWSFEFNEEATTQEMFHGICRDSVADMMHTDLLCSVYRTENFTSLGLPLTDSGSMYFYLPNDGVDINSLASDPYIINAIEHHTLEEHYDEHRKNCIVHMSVPKFNISYKTDLLDMLTVLGVTDSLDPKLSDFTPLTGDADEIYISRAEHAAMVEIDEHGVTGAAYTDIMLEGGAPEIEYEIDFILDRPFMFIITGYDGSILFSGIIRNM